jgi:apolipoprotein D and lipocalin family protein
MKTYKSLDEAVQHVKQVEKDIEKKFEKNLHRLQKKTQNTLKRQQRELRKWQIPTSIENAFNGSVQSVERKWVLPTVATLGGLVLAGIGIMAVIQGQKKVRQKQIESLRSAPSISRERFAGRWFEIAHLPYHAEKNHVGSRKTFTLQEDGYKVEYDAAVGSLDGKSVKKEGYARVIDDNNTHMRLKLFGPLEMDYIILEKGPDYDYVVLGSPNKKQAWIMSRTPVVDQKQYNGIVGRLKEQGYSTDALIKVEQDSHAEVPLHIHLKKKLEEKNNTLNNQAHQKQVERQQKLGDN